MSPAAGSVGTDRGVQAAPSPRFTRRHWGREFVRAWLDVTGMFRGASGKLSQLRVTVAVFGTAFVVHWPQEWTSDAVTALAILVFAVPVDALFSRVPVGETLGALQAFFGAVGAKATDTYTRYRSRSYSSVETGPAYDPPPPASDGAVG